MKASKLILAIVFLLMGTFTSELLAQKNLDVLVKRFGDDKSIDKSVIQQKDPKTKVLNQVIKSFTIEGNAALAKEVLSAFEKDKEDAYQVIENERNGIASKFFEFAKDKGSISYSFNISSQGDGGTLTVIESFRDKSESLNKLYGIDKQATVRDKETTK